MTEQQAASEGFSEEELAEIQQSFENPFAKMQDDTHMKKVIGVVSGKGGVGKSFVTSYLATQLNKQGFKVGVLDTDATGPSIPRMIGVEENMRAAKEPPETFIPAHNAAGIKLMSVDLILAEATEPVIWRGPVVSGVIRQFWCDTHWGDIDVMLIDMPPGTGDVALTVFQNLGVDGLVIVASPQDLVETIATKAIRMAAEMEVPVIALVENMSYAVCPDCGAKIKVFGESKLADIAEQYGIGTYVSMPIDTAFAKAADQSRVAELEIDDLVPLVDVLKEGL
ncbi:MAG: P-loop NTPase [Actinomycetota bacterium]|nr:P-loop NTPase [Actinomycetota bacterium]